MKISHDQFEIHGDRLRHAPTGALFWMGETLICATHGRGMFRIDLSGV